MGIIIVRDDKIIFENIDTIDDIENYFPPGYCNNIREVLHENKFEI